MTTKTLTATEQLEQLKAEVEHARRLPSGIKHEREQLEGAVEMARGALRRFYRSGAKDEAKLAKLRGAVEEAERAADQRWDDRVAAAKTAAVDAQGKVRAFIEDNFDDLVRERVADARVRHERLMTAWAEFAAAWRDRSPNFKELTTVVPLPEPTDQQRRAAKARRPAIVGEGRRSAFGALVETFESQPPLPAIPVALLEDADLGIEPVGV